VTAAETTDAPRQLPRFDLKETPAARPMLVRGLVPFEAVGMVTGLTGVAKTIVTLDLARAVVQGSTWLGRRVNRQGPVVVLDAENHPRFDALPRVRALRPVLTDGQLDQIHYIPAKGLSSLTVDAWQTQVDIELAAIKPVLVIVDSVFAAAPRHDTNNNDTAGAWMACLARLAEQHNCTVLPLHHWKKPSKEAGGDVNHQASGAAQYVNQSSFHIPLVKVKQGAEDQPDGTRRIYTVVTAGDEAAKVRSTVGASKLHVAIESVESTENAAGDRLLMEMVVRPLSDDEAAEYSTSTLMVITDALRTAELNDDGSITRKDLLALTKLPESTLDKNVKDGVARGVLRQVGRGRVGLVDQGPAV
jgi:hypothetical protein